MVESPGEDAAGPRDDETAIVPPTQPAPELAWSQDEDDDAGGASVSWGAVAGRASVILMAAAAVAVAVGLLTWLGLSLHNRTKPTPVPHATTPVVTEPAAELPPITAPAPAAAPSPPPATVTVTAAPPSTVTVEVAPPPPPSGGAGVFTICPDGHEGVVGGHTSCAFAENVRRIFYATGMADSFTAFSPVTGEAYAMTCVGRYPAYFTDGSTKISTRCDGGDNAEVVIW